MDYKLFEDYITLQALLKDLGIIQSGGAVKAFLAEHTVLFNGEDEKRRGKKIRIGDVISLPDQALTITLTAPSSEEIAAREADLAEKARVAQLVKDMNKTIKKQPRRQNKSKAKGPARFPGT